MNATASKALDAGLEAIRSLLGERLTTAQRTYDELAGVRRRQLERPLDSIDDLRRSKGLAADPLLRPAAEIVPLDIPETG